MTTLVVIVVVAVIIGVISYYANAGFGDRRGHAPGELPSSRDIEARLAPLEGVAVTRIDAARDGSVKIAGKVEAVEQPWGDAQRDRRWAARITPSDAGGIRARVVIADVSGRALVEIPFGGVESFAHGVAGWEVAGGTPALVPGQEVTVVGAARRRAPGYRDGAHQLVVVAAYVSGDPPPSR